MVDAALSLGPVGADLSIVDGDLELDLGLLSGCFVSLFTDARAPDGERSDPRGWWGDRAGARLGSLLWLLEREKLTLPAVARLREAATRSLDWLIDEGIAKTVEVDAGICDDGSVSLVVRIDRVVAGRWDSAWEGQQAQFEADGRIRSTVLIR